MQAAGRALIDPTETVKTGETGRNSRMHPFTAMEWASIGLAVVVWMSLSFFLAPQFGSTDVYLFRDAAINLAHGRGFRTASFEHSTSFVALLYSSYTPVSLWVFVPFARIFGNPQLAATVFNLVLSVISVVAAAWATLTTVPKGRLRQVLLLGFMLILPVGFPGGEAERPEALSFLGLLLMLKILGSERRPIWLAGLLGGLLFLIQPFAGVLAVTLIAIAVLGRKRADSFRSFALSVAKEGVLSGLAFAVPIAVTALAFQHKDPQSLQRFKTQATVAGVSRRPSTAVSGTEQESNPKAAKPPSGLGRYEEALRFHLGLGPLVKLSLFEALLFLAIWVWLVASARGNWAGKLALFGCGFMTLVLPAVMFPMQLNYLLLGRAFLPFCLLLNFLGCRDVIRVRQAPVAMVALNLALLLPIVGLVMIMRVETKPSYEREMAQVQKLKQYLTARNQQESVVMVPPTHYFLFKTELNNLLNGEYLAPEHDVSQIAAVVNCPAASPYFDARKKPMYPLLKSQRWTQLDLDNQPGPITLFGKPIMTKNWTWGCVVYVRAS
jgi:Glycosyltransferase family 87